MSISPLAGASGRIETGAGAAAAVIRARRRLLDRGLPKTAFTAAAYWSRSAGPAG